MPSRHPCAFPLGAQEMRQALEITLSASEPAPIGDIRVDVVELLLNVVERHSQRQDFEDQPTHL